MRNTGGERAFVDDDTQGSLSNSIGRLLEAVAPDSMVSGGASLSDHFGTQRRPRNYEALKQREQIYAAGGPITEFIDTRALMTYGTGVEFTTTEKEITADVEGQAEPMTVDEWLTDQFPMVDQLMIERGIQTYVFGDCWPEVVMTRGGGVSHLNLVDPTTVDPRWDQHGEIQQLTQIIVDSKGKPRRKSLDLDQYGHWYHKRAMGGPLGESLIEQNHQEIEWYINNQTQRSNAIRIHGSPKYHIGVGAEGQSVPDRLLRRIRDRFNSDGIDETTNWVTGGDLEISELDAPGFQGMESITETDVIKLASGMGIPIEWTNFGSAGLGDGTPAESRIKKFERQARAEQKRAAEQMQQFPLRWIVDEISPFPRGTQFDVEFGDVVSDKSKIAEWLEPFSDQFTDDEIRNYLGAQELTDEQRQEIEERRESDSGADGGMGLFRDGRSTAPESESEHGHTHGHERALMHSEDEVDHLTDAERAWSTLYESVLWSNEGERRLFEFDPEEVPEFVVERLREAVRAGALFSDFEGISAAGADRIQSTLLDSLEESHGWSINSLTNNIQEAAGDIERSQAEAIARTETQSLVNTAREEGYAEQYDLEEARFTWVGPSDSRNSEVCPAIIERIDEIEAETGQEGVPLDTLQDIVTSTAREFGHDPRRWTPHVNCRHTFTRVVA